MRDVIQLLERLACDSRPLPDPDRDAALARLEPITRAALEQRDPVALARALGHPVTFACMILVPEEQPDPDREPEEQDVPDEPCEPSGQVG
jgi:hypothetical protein